MCSKTDESCKTQESISRRSEILESSLGERNTFSRAGLMAEKHCPSAPLSLSFELEESVVAKQLMICEGLW